MDYFGNIDNIKTAFKKYIKLLPDDGILVFNGDDENCKELEKCTNAKTVTFGIKNETADYVAKNINFDDNGFPTFDVYKSSNLLDTFKLSISGMHNVLNATSCIALCDNYKVPIEAIKKALASFTGASRRLEYKGSFNNISVFDDYAHHPTEIKATADSLNRKKFNESWVVFQPHTYSRLKNLLNDFAESLLTFDHIVLTDVYAAREKNVFNVTSKDLVDKLVALGKPVQYISEFENIEKYLKRSAKSGDVILTLGAGTVTEISDMLVQ